MDPDTRRLMLFAGGLGVILSILIGTSAIIGRRSTEVPVITADTRPIRIKPENPGGMKIDGAENDVFSGGADNKNARLAAGAETPDTKALSADEAPRPRAATKTPAQATATALSADAMPSNLSPSSVSPSSLVPASVSPTTPVPAAPSVVAQAKPAVVSVLPPAKPAAARPTTPAKSAATTTETHTAAGHQAVVQLAALTSEEAARNEWQLLVKRMPDLLNGHQPNYTRTERDGHTFWRVRTSGFADVAQARGFCDHVRAKGGGCSVADF